MDSRSSSIRCASAASSSGSTTRPPPTSTFTGLVVVKVRQDSAPNPVPDGVGARPKGEPFVTTTTITAAAAAVAVDVLEERRAREAQRPAAGGREGEGVQRGGRPPRLPEEDHRPARPEAA